MAAQQRLVGVVQALGRASWRDLRSFQSIAGQNLFLFVAFVALQPESAQFFFALLVLVLLFPLSADPMQKIPAERRRTWPLAAWEWALVRAASLAMSPISWIAVVLLFSRTDLGTDALVVGSAAVLQLLSYFAKRLFTKRPKTNGLYWIPAPPGMTGALMRLQWRGMVRTLDLYIALLLLICSVIFMHSGRKVDPAMPRMMALMIALALSTQAQVLFGIDGTGVTRYRLLPIRGWQILLAKDLAFLVVLGLLAAPLDFVSGMIAGVVVLAVGHHRSVYKIVPQTPWRFTSGMLFPDGVLQIMVLFGAGNTIKEHGWWLPALCLCGWLLSVFLYGWLWDRKNERD